MENNNQKLIERNPEKAIIKLAGPIIVLMIITTLYNVVDGIWITGVGSAAVAGVGVITPLFTILTGISAGMSTGATSAVGYYVGFKKNTSLTIKSSIFIFFITSIIVTIVMLFFLKNFLMLFNVDNATLKEGLNYGIVIFLGSASFIFSSGLMGIFRGGGETKKPTYALSFAFILNALLDPFFIYTLNLGVIGAAVSSVFTNILATAILYYWLFIKKTIFKDLNSQKFRIDKNIISRILKVGIPSSFEVFLMSIAASLFIYFTSLVSGSFGVSVYSLGYRIYLLGLTPITAISVALIIVVSNYYGAKNMNNIKRAFKFTCKFGICLGFVFMIIMQVFSHPLSLLFSFGKDTSNLLPDISLFISITTLAFPFLGIGIPSTFFFQGLSKGYHSLFWATLREFIFPLVFTYFLGIMMNMGLFGIWIGLFIGRTMSSILNFVYSNHTVNNL